MHNTLTSHTQTARTHSYGVSSARPCSSGHRHAIRRSHAREGRALVELIISSFLLTIATAACLSLLSATTTFADRVVRTSIARDMARDAAELLEAAPCNAAAGSETRNRTVASWSASSSSAIVTLEFSVSFPPTPFATHTPRSLAATFAGWCT